MKTIVVCSQKGGVGKTTLAINLAHALSRAGKKTLLVDSDTQGSVGLSLTQQSRHFLGFYDYLKDYELSLAEAKIVTREETMSLMIAGKASNYNENTSSTINFKARITDLINEADEEGVDYLIVDTSAGIIGVTEDFLALADGVIVPQQAEPLGVRSIPKLLQALAEVKGENTKMKMLGVILTMVQRSLKESVGAADSLRRLLPEGLVFNSEIMRDDLFIKASARGVPIAVMKTGEVYADLFDEIMGEVEDKFNI